MLRFIMRCIAYICIFIAAMIGIALLIGYIERRLFQRTYE
ncbi:MAG: hypothetical protein K0R28_6885 [Paenibacillus sp.]|jgi:hypothetical protein|nr:hypothetical protein [Paenibacillus sp.]